jgi:hypothetical protein
MSERLTEDAQEARKNSAPRLKTLAEVVLRVEGDDLGRRRVLLRGRSRRGERGDDQYDGRSTA